MPRALRPTRKTRAGKAYGNWYVELKGGERVNLRTKDAERARKRAKEADRGVRAWPDDGDGGEAGAAASAVAASVAGTAGGKPAVVEPPAPSSPGPVPLVGASPAALPPMPGPAAAPPSGTSIKPDAYIPPGNAPGWAAGVAAAAAHAEGAKADAEAEAESDGEADPLVDVEFIRELVQQAAALAVEAQIWTQEWLLKRGWVIPKTKIRAGQVPADNKGREIGQKLWAAQIKKWVNVDDLPQIPEWVAAMLMVGAYTMPAQLAEENGAAEILDDKPRTQQRPPAPPAPEAVAA
jgi:hypothetical protein